MRRALRTRSSTPRQSEDINALLTGGPEVGEFPRRFGYYVGLRASEELGREHSLAELARMPPERVKAALTEAIDRLIQKAGGCK